jgi:hypothetical protein
MVFLKMRIYVCCLLKYVNVFKLQNSNYNLNKNKSNHT